MKIPAELQPIVTQLEQQGATVLLATLTDEGGYATAPKLATIVWDSKGQKVLYSAAGNIVEGLFELTVGRQHPISDERWEQMKNVQTQG